MSRRTRYGLFIFLLAVLATWVQANRAEAFCQLVIVKATGKSWPVGALRPKAQKKRGYARARRRASRRWKRYVKRQYGSAFASFGYARDAEVWCDPVGRKILYTCHKQGRPCDKFR